MERSAQLFSQELVSAVIKAYDVRGLVGEQIGAEFVRAVGASFARLMKGEGQRAVVVGHDMRESSPGLAEAFADGALDEGLDVTLIGLASTDQLYFASGILDRPGAMFTASHNPASYNGIKMCRAGAKPVGQDSGLATISRELVEGLGTESAGPGGDAGTPTTRGVLDERDVLKDYAAFLHKLVDLSGLRHLTVAVDAGNGMGGHTVPVVLGGSEAFTVRSLYFELDGTFPNHEANPLDPKNLVDLQAYVKETGADIGLAFDGDADRCFVVDELGDPVSPSAVTALVAERELAKNPGSVVIHNLITSRAVPELVRELGGVPLETRVGHSFIKAQMAETGAVFGGEHSAHYYFRDFWGADSGLLAAMHVLAALGSSDQPLSKMMARYERYASSGEINSTVDDQAARTAAVLADFGDEITGTARMDGVTVDLADGSWFNLRASNTEPLLRLNVEAATTERVHELTERILGVVRG